MIEFLQSTYRFVQSKRSRQLERFLGIVLLVTSLFFVSTILIRGWEQLRPHLSRVSLIPLIAGQICIIIALILGAVMWSLIQQAIGLGFSWQESMTIHMISSITKYVPGYAWQYVSKAYLSKRHGSSAKPITLAILTEFALLITGGVVTVATWGLLGYQDWQLAWRVPSWGWVLAGSIGLLVGTGWNLAASRLAISEDGFIARTRLLWSAFGIGMIGWIMFAAAAWLLSSSVYSVDLSMFPQHVVALVISVIGGLIIVIVPGGLGIRETLLALLLAGILPFTLALVVGVMIRISIILWELVGFGIAFRLRKGKPEECHSSGETVG